MCKMCAVLETAVSVIRFRLKWPGIDESSGFTKGVLGSSFEDPICAPSFDVLRNSYDFSLMIL